MGWRVILDHEITLICLEYLIYKIIITFLNNKIIDNSFLFIRLLGFLGYENLNSVVGR